MLHIGEGYVRVPETEYGGVVRRVVDGPVALYDELALECTIICILIDNDIKRAGNLFLIAILSVGPFARVEKLLDCILKGREHFIVRALYL